VGEAPEGARLSCRVGGGVLSARHKEELTFGDSITQFMQRLGEGKRVSSSSARIFFDDAPRIRYAGYWRRALHEFEDLEQEEGLLAFGEDTVKRYAAMQTFVPQIANALDALSSR
jgi:hypothetical protein